jgi:hypothetical protein
MHARETFLTNVSFKDGIEIEMKWVITIIMNENYYISESIKKETHLKALYFMKKIFHINNLTYAVSCGNSRFNSTPKYFF